MDVDVESLQKHTKKLEAQVGLRAVIISYPLFDFFLVNSETLLGR